MQATTLPQLLQQGAAFFAQGRLESARDIFTQILQSFPSQPDALLHLAVIAGRQDELDISADLFRQLLAIEPENPQAHYNLAITLIKQKNYSAAEDVLKQLVKLSPSMLEAFISLSSVLEQQQKWTEALSLLQDFLAHTPNHLQALYHMGLCFQAQNELDKAIACFQQVLSLDVQNTPAALSLSLLLRQNSQLPEAESLITTALSNSPENHLLLKELADIKREAGQLPESITLYQKAAALQPLSGIFLNLGVALQASSNPSAAIHAYNQAYSLDPSPGILGNRAQAILQTGDLELGFREYEWRTQTEEQKSLFSWCSHKPRWTGEYFSGKRLLVHHEQGLGDNLQFVRYLPLVKARGGVVVMSTKKPLMRLFQSCPGIDYVIEHTEADLKKLHYDLVIPLMSLPGIFGTTLSTIPKSIPYIQPDPSLTSVWASHLAHTNIPDTHLKIGLVWSGSGSHTAGWNRNIPLSLLSPLGQLPHTAFFSLQIGPSSNQLNEIGNDFHIFDLTEHIEDFADTAAFITCLDIILSVDTAVPHLAGALGKTTWLLLPFTSEWRWLCHKTDTPWYPSMQLFRQREYGNWDNVVQQVAKKLSDLTKS